MYYWFHQSFYMAKAFPFIGGWLADRLLGDPEGWPHPVVGFGKVISLGEKTLNKGNDRAVKGGVMALILVAGTYLLCFENGFHFFDQRFSRQAVKDAYPG